VTDTAAYVIFFTAAVFLLAGTIKGTVGIGLPAIAISFLIIIFDPRTALALVTLPLVATNLWQSIQSRYFFPGLKRFWPLIISLPIGTWVGAHIMASMDTQLLIGLIGAIVVLFVATSYLHPHVHLSRRSERWASPVAGLVAGIMGGLSALPGPPTVMYLVALNLSKEEFIGSVGLIWFCGSVPLVVSYTAYGILGPREALWSLVAILPSLTGILLGQWIRNRINQDAFRNVVLGFLALLGLNLLRRAFL